MEKKLGTYYKHNGHQATVMASLIAKNKKYTSMKLPTASGKTYIGGGTASFHALKRNLKVAILTLSDTLKSQM
jgi:replicative superfamily II helicase